MESPCPKTFFGRSLAIIIVPVLTLQFVLIYVFYERHWEDVGRRLALALGGQVSYVIEDFLKEKDANEHKNMFLKAERLFLIKSNFYINATLKDYNQHEITSLLDNTLKNSLKERIYVPHKFDTKIISLIFNVNINSFFLQFKSTNIKI